jgi:hypothetical protein
MAPHPRLRRTLLFAVASAACASADSWPGIVPRADGIDFSTAPPDLTTLGNNSLFTHWRPKAHFIAPNSWMNDPMTLWYKADGQGGGKFKASYQAHPNHLQVGAQRFKEVACTDTTIAVGKYLTGVRCERRPHSLEGRSGLGGKG